MRRSLNPAERRQAALPQLHCQNRSSGEHHYNIATFQGVSDSLEDAGLAAMKAELLTAAKLMGPLR